MSPDLSQACITYLKLDFGFVFLVAIMDMYSRKVLSPRESSSMDADFCIEALNEAMHRYGVPAILNSDQCVSPMFDPDNRYGA